jgi:hypothetical protein
MEKEKNQIPFIKAVRVNNFKLWRSRYKANGADIDSLNISTLDGAWMVRLPSTLEMYGFLMAAYNDYVSDDVTVKSQGEAVLSIVISNILYASSIGNGYYQRALEICATLYIHPSLLSKKEKEHKAFMKDVKGLVEAYLDWRKVYDETVKAQEPTEEQMRQDEIAEEALQVLSEEEGGES